jgi:potassium channel LctB
MAFYVILIFVLLCIIMSLRLLFMPRRFKGKQISFENFMYLAMLYATIMIGFGVIYFLLEMKGFLVIVESTQTINLDFFSRLITFIYFSGVTLFSVGYGDIAPIGFSRIVVVLEALIGYAIPAAFVARAVFDKEQ